MTMNDKEQAFSRENLQRALGAEVASRIVEVEIRSVYGNNLLYPVNQVAKDFAELLGVKTFNRAQVEGMKKLGYEVLRTAADPVQL